MWLKKLRKSVYRKEKDAILGDRCKNRKRPSSSPLLGPCALLSLVPQDAPISLKWTSPFSLLQHGLSLLAIKGSRHESV